MATKDIDENIGLDDLDDKKKKRWRFLKNINYEKIFVRSIVLAFVSAICFMCSYWRDEGELGTGPIRNFLADIFIIFQFPSLFILVKTGYYSWTTYIIGLFVNVFLFSAIIQIIYFFLYKIFKPTTQAKFRLPGLIIVVIGIILIIIAESFSFTKTNLPPIAFTDGYNPYDHYSTTKSALLYTAFGVTLLGVIIFVFNPRRHLKEINPPRK
jgi:hypothetical protein